MTNQEVQKKETKSEEISSLEAKFTESVKKGILEWKNAGEALVKLVSIDPEIIDKLQRKTGMSRSVLSTFVLIGKGELLPQLVTAPSYVRRLPISDQEKIASGSVEALVMRPNGETDTVKVDVLRAPADMIRQIIGASGIRTLPEQRAVLISCENKKQANKVCRPTVVPWRVEGKRIVVQPMTTLTRSDLLSMMAAIGG